MPTIYETKPAEITVFLALITAVMVTLIFTVVESARTRCTETYLQIAANSAEDSLFSQYHLELWDSYRLLGTEMYSVQEIKQEYSSFLQMYLDGTEAVNWYCLKAEEKDLTVNGYQLMVDENGAVFEQQVKDYMACGILLDLAGVESMKTTVQQLMSAKQTGAMSGKLAKDSRTARNLDRKLKSLAKAVQEHNRQVQALERALSAGQDVESGLRRLQAEIDKVDRLLPGIRELAAKLAAETEENRTELNRMKSAGELTEEAYLQLNEQLKSYEMYTNDQGEKKQELDQLEQTVRFNLELLVEINEKAAEAEEDIRNWVPSQILVGYRPAEKPGDPPVPIYEEEVRDEAEAWIDTLRCFEKYENLVFEDEHSLEADQEKAGQLDGLTELLQGNLLEAVYPDQEKLSREKLDLTGCPSSEYLEEKTNLFSSWDYTLNKLAVDEYAMLELSELLTENQETVSAEIEYVLCGKESDMQNVSSVAAELIGIRTGMNYLYLLQDADSVKIAGAVANVITGGTPVVSVIVQYALLGVWAGAQAVLDVRELMDGGKVPFMHNSTTFQLDLEHLLNAYQALLQSGTGEHRETGMDYQAYLRLLLLFRSGSQTDYRIMDVIQWNLRKEQTDFRMDRLYTAMDIRVDAKSRRLFTRWNESLLSRLFTSSEYTVTAEAYKEY